MIVILGDNVISDDFVPYASDLRVWKIVAIILLQEGSDLKCFGVPKIDGNQIVRSLEY